MTSVCIENEINNINQWFVSYHLLFCLVHYFIVAFSVTHLSVCLSPSPTCGLARTLWRHCMVCSRGSQHDLSRERSVSPDYYGTRRYRCVLIFCFRLFFCIIFTLMRSVLVFLTDFKKEVIRGCISLENYKKVEKIK